MGVEQRIRVAVAWADVTLCAALRWAGVIAVLTAALLLAILAVRRLARADPCQVDYDAPGADVTSEGPEGYTEQWYRFEEDENDVG